MSTGLVKSFGVSIEASDLMGTVDGVDDASDDASGHDQESQDQYAMPTHEPKQHPAEDSAKHPAKFCHIGESTVHASCAPVVDVQQAKKLGKNLLFDPGRGSMQRV